ncbi:MAG TPA: helix-turn-helix domain-containing protein, partial [Thermoclostridium caenicola]
MTAIEKSLNEGRSFKDIARYLCKDPTTISKEVKLHRLSDWYHYIFKKLSTTFSKFIMPNFS